jgi:hypothetical protein
VPPISAEKFYVIGGTGFDGVSESTLADVWTSTDGKLWSLVTDSASFGARNRHKCIVHDGKLWVIGGRNGSGVNYSDVWFTSDGTSWESDALPEGGVVSGANFAVISKGNNLFVFGTATLGRCSCGLQKRFRRLVYSHDTFLWI